MTRTKTWTEVVFMLMMEAAIAFAVSALLFFIWTLGTGDIYRIFG